MDFILKKRKALRADKENIALVNKKKDELNKKNEEAKKTFKEIAAKINKKTLTFSKEAKDNGELFGSIKPKEVSNSFLTNLKVEINPSQIDLKQEINKIGTYKIDINLFSEVSASISVIVKKAESN
mgnify:FL=1